MHLNKTRFMDRRVVYTQPTEQTASSLPLVFLYFLFFFFFYFGLSSQFLRSRKHDCDCKTVKELVRDHVLALRPASTSAIRFFFF